MTFGNYGGMYNMKTIKYFIEFVGIDNDMSTQIEISKKVYDANVKLLEKQIIDIQNDEYSMDKRVYTHDYTQQHLKETRTYYTIGTSDTILTILQCYEGYHFSK